MGRRRKKKKILLELVIFIVILLIIVLLLPENIRQKVSEELKISVGDIQETHKVKENTEFIEKVAESINIQEGKLNILFFDVGQADSELIIYNGKTCLIDAGNRNDGEALVSGIKALGISKLDYVIGTHIHEDHIGGMNDIIEEFEIGEYYMPYNTTTTTSYYEKLLETLTNKQEPINEAVVGNKINLDDITLEIMTVDNEEPEDANDASITIEMTYGIQKYLFMGDATKENEEERKWNDVDVLKVGHHGSNTSSSQEFLNQIVPEIAIISVGKDNSYGLPKENIVKRIKDLGTEIYRTDELGTIQIVSDGTKNEVIKINLSFDGNK